MPAWLFASLQGYRIGWLPRDLVAGLMLAAIAIPGQLATARLAGMPPETGLYAFAAGALAFAALGGNRFMSVAADSTIAPIFAGALSSIAMVGSPHYIELATLLSVLVGLTLAAVGLLRAGWLATLLSIPVTTGFLAGISIHIIVSQLPDLLGIQKTDGHMLVQLVHILGQMGEANLDTLALGAGVLVVTLGAAMISNRIPGALIGLVGAGLAVFLFHLEARGVDVLGALSVPPPRFALPINPGIGEWSQLVPLALVVAMVCIMQTAAVASVYPSDPDAPDDTSRDFLGVGAGSILSGLVGSFAVDSSPPSTAIVHDSGGRSQVASLTAVALMIALAVLASGAMAYVPRAALAGILVYIAIKIFRVGDMINIARRGGREILLVVASAALVVVLPIESGMLLAIVLSFVHSLYIVARPYCAELARVPGTTVWWPPMPHDHIEHEPGVLVFAPAAPLNFTNVQDIVGRIRKAIATRKPPVKLLVIEASGIIDIDYTGAQLLRRAIVDLRKKGITVAIARLSHEQAQREAGRTGLVQSVGRDHVFMSVEEAVHKLGPGNSAGDFG